MKLPLRSLNTTFHVGNLDINEKDYTGYEGYTLSVSPCPDDWRWIAHLSGEDHKLTKDGGLFVEFHDLTEAKKEAIYAWGSKNGYVYEDTVYKYVMSDEDGKEMYGLCMSYGDAFDESGEDEDAVTEVTAYLSTDKMNEFMKHDVSLMNVFDFLLIMYVDLNTDLDGVYWDDILDRDYYSAPRGGIVPRALSSWKIELAQDGEWDDENEWADEEDE